MHAKYLVTTLTLTALTVVLEPSPTHAQQDILDGLVFGPGRLTINGLAPFLLRETNAEQILVATIPYTVPADHPGGAQMWIRIFPSGRVHADFGEVPSNYLTCGPGERTGDDDILVEEISWTNPDGGYAYLTTDPNLGTDETPPPELRQNTFRFGLLCHDNVREETESFTIEAWFTDGGRNRSPAIASIGRILDDDGLPAPTPLNFTAVVSSPTSVILSWDRPESGDVNGYEIRYRTSGVNGSNWSPNTHLDNADDLTLTVRGLNRGSWYRFQARSRDDRMNPDGGTDTYYSSWVEAGPILIPETDAPSTPLNLVLTSRAGDLVATWDEPRNVEEIPVSKYTLRFRGTGLNDKWHFVTVDATQLQTRIPASYGLVRGGTYRAQVRATGTGGDSPWAAEAQTTITLPEPQTPSAPLNLVLESNAGDLIATWDEPSDIDDVPVSGYTLRFRGTGLNDKWYTETIAANVLQARIPASYGLVRGGTYRAQVRATGTGGDGPWSAEAQTTITLPEPQTPSAPLNLVLESNAGDLIATWDEPSDIDDVPVSGYTLRFRGTGLNDKWYTETIAANVLQAQIPASYGLVRGGTYRAQVRATGTGGDSPWSAEAQTTITLSEPQTPSAPLNLVLESNAGDLIATWDEPSDINDVPISGYTLRFRGTALNEEWHTVTVAANVLQARIPASYGFVRSGTYRAQVRASGADGDGPWSAEAQTTIPGAGPKPVITATIEPPANRPFTITVTFPELVTNFTLNDIVVAGGDASEFTRTGAVYTALVTPTESGTLTVDIPFGAAVDANGYDSDAAETFSIKVDITAPTGVITTTQPGPFKDPFTIELVFSEPVQDLSLENISINLGEVTNLEATGGSETEYTALVTPRGSGTLTIELPSQTFYDYNENWNETPVRFEVGVDTVPPTLTITTTTAPPVKGPFPLTFTFSEEVNGFDRDDIEFPTGAAWLQNLHKTGATTYTGTAKPTITGEILVRVPKGAVTDAIGHENEEAEFQVSAFIDEDPERPRVDIWSTATSPVHGPFEIRIDFSEPVLGMTADKLIVKNGAAGPLTDRQNARTEYSTTVWPERNATVTVNLPEGAVTDDLGNPSHAAPEFSIEALLTPVPAVPTPGLMLLGAALAAAAWRKRRQADRA